MHADVIVVGQRCEAYLAAHLFARRGFRTLLIGPSTKPMTTGRMLLEPDLAARLKPVEPPEETIIARNLTVEFWSPDERRHAVVRQLPFLLIDEAAFSRTLELAATRTRNFKMLRGLSPQSLLVSKGSVAGVKLGTGDDINARLVVEVDPLIKGAREQLKGLWPQPDLIPFQGRFFCQRRQVGTAAQAWTMGTLAMRVKPGQHVHWNYRVQPDVLEVGAFMVPGCKLKPEPLVGRTFRDTGLDDSPVLGELPMAPHFAPPVPTPLAPGYLAIGQVAGQANPWLPTDRTAALGGALQAWLAGADALDEGKPTMEAMWEYVRALATDQGARQANAYSLSAAILHMDSTRLEALFKSGLLDTYFLSCLARSRRVREDFLDTFTRSLKAIGHPGSVVTWHGMLRKAHRLAELYRAVPLRFDRSEAMTWQEKVLKSW
jgi:hypothetical protein